MSKAKNMAVSIPLWLIGVVYTAITVSLFRTFKELVEDQIALAIAAILWPAWIVLLTIAAIASSILVKLRLIDE